MAGLPLLNTRWEKFCQAYVRGPTAGNASASYAAAGFPGEGTATARSGAHRLLHKPSVRARIEELQADLMRVEERAVATAAERLSLDKQVVLAQLRRLGFANLIDYVRRDESGGTVIDLGAIERDEAAGIVELSVTERGEGERRVSTMRIRLCDRHAPLVSLGKHLGLFADRRKDPQEHVRGLTREELRQQVAGLNRKVGHVFRSPSENESPVAPSPPALTAHQPMSAGCCIDAFEALSDAPPRCADEGVGAGSHHPK